MQIFDPKTPTPLKVIITLLALFYASNIILSAVAAINGLYSLFIVNFIVTTIFLIPLYGLWKIKRWGRFAFLFLSLLTVVLSAANIYSGMGEGSRDKIINSAVGLILNGALAAYLLSDGCVRVFAKEKK